MSWMQALYDTYEACQSEIGKLPAEGKVPLLPIYHSTQQAQLQVAVDTQGNWCPGRGRVILEKRDMTTLIPCTEKSASRTSSPEPHPLFDKLQYVAGDYIHYGPEKKYCYPRYLELLSDWCDSPYGHQKVCAVRDYLQKGTLMRDLADDQLLYRTPDGDIPEKWEGPKDEAYPIFKVCAGQWEAFVRFQVFDGSLDTSLWADPSVWQSWIDYQNHLVCGRDLCYVTGQEKPVSELSPKKIRNSGDQAKLISSNDQSGFTFRGRFDLPSQAACVGRETTEKAHSALKWLISKQAYFNGDQVILTWNIQKQQPPERILADNSLDLYKKLNDQNEAEAVLADVAANTAPAEIAEPEEDIGDIDLSGAVQPEQIPISTGAAFADQFKKSLYSYIKNLEGWEKSAVIGLDSATPGRLSIFYYRELQARDLFARILRWHTSCTWLYTYHKEPAGVDKKGKPIMLPHPFVGAASPRDIIEAAYGRNADDKLKKSATQRLLPCILDNAPLPQDMVFCAAHRATNSIALEPWEAQKTRTVACSLIRKFYNDKNRNRKKTSYPLSPEEQQEIKEEWTVELDQTQTDRSYLFGRVLAYARKIEEYAQWMSGNEAHQTNAERRQVIFSQHPMRTWKLMHEQLSQGYFARFRGTNPRGALGRQYEQELNHVLRLLGEANGYNDAPLSPLYLLGYQSQLDDFAQRDKARREANEAKKAKDGKEGTKA